MNNEKHCLHPFVWHCLRGHSGIHTQNCGNVFFSFESNSASPSNHSSFRSLNSQFKEARDVYDICTTSPEYKTSDVSSSVTLARHLALTNHIIYLYSQNAISPNGSSPCIPISNDCYLLNPSRGVLELIQLRNPSTSNIDFSSLFGNTNTYIRHLLQRKQWHDLLTGPFALLTLNNEADTQSTQSTLQAIDIQHSTSISSLGLSALTVQATSENSIDDEKNLWIPQNERTEVATLSNVRRHLMKDGNLMTGFVQHAVLGAYKLTEQTKRNEQADDGETSKTDYYM